MEIYDKQKCVNYFLEKYPHLSQMDLECMYDSAYEIFLKTKYHSNYNITKIPDNVYLRNNTWFLRAMQCWIDKEGMNVYTAYSENGVSFTFDRAGLSQDLIDEISPCVFIR